jgi:EF hand domain-containing protein
VQIQMKSRMLSGAVLAMAIGLAAASTFAHDGKTAASSKMGGSDMMGMIDTNHDGNISAAEHAAYAQGMFDKMDSNHDGMVSKAELDAGMKAMHGDRMKAHPAMDNGHDAESMHADMPSKSTPESTPPPSTPPKK